MSSRRRPRASYSAKVQLALTGPPARTGQRSEPSASLTARGCSGSTGSSATGCRRPSTASRPPGPPRGARPSPRRVRRTSPSTISVSGLRKRTYRALQVVAPRLLACAKPGCRSRRPAPRGTRARRALASRRSTRYRRRPHRATRPRRARTPYAGTVEPVRLVRRDDDDRDVGVAVWIRHGSPQRVSPRAASSPVASVDVVDRLLALEPLDEVGHAVLEDSLASNPSSSLARAMSA